MKKFMTSCDMGSIKIASRDVSLFFANGIGDGKNFVEIDENGNGLPPANRYEFLEHFTVKREKTTYLCEYDCEDTPIHYFGVGRWFVYLKKPAHFLICLCDKETHS